MEYLDTSGLNETTMGLYKVAVETDTVWRDKRITTVVATYPRIIHSEVMTHRRIVKNSSSSRAVPARKMLEQVTDTPFVPLRFGAAQPGMQMSPRNVDGALRAWLNACDDVRVSAKLMLQADVHKSIINRMLEPWSWITVVMTASEWNNFFHLRRHPDADIHIHLLADMIYDAISASTPRESDLHMPFIDFFSTMSGGLGRWTLDELAAISAARCARVSYLTHDGGRDVERDFKLAEKLRGGSGGIGHWSPFEHFAKYNPTSVSPYVGWQSYRSMCTGHFVSGNLSHKVSE